MKKFNFQEMLDVKGAAEYLGIKPRILNTWCCRNKGPAYHKLSYKIFYFKADLDTFVQNGRVDQPHQLGFLPKWGEIKKAYKL